MKDRALVIEHDPQAVEQIEDVLAALSHEYDLAASLLQARKLMKAGKYCYVLLDVEFPTRSAGGVPRIQNAENFLEELGTNEDGDAPPVIVLCEHVAHDLDGTEDLMRLAMLLGRKGATDLIKKPFPTGGRTLDRVIKKVLGISRTRNAPGSARHARSAGEVDGHWLTVTEAARLLMRDLLGLDLKRARARVSTGARRAEFRTNGQERRARRIEPTSFDAWRLKQRDRDLDAEDDQ